MVGLKDRESGKEMAMVLADLLARETVGLKDWELENSMALVSAD